eukprot:GHVS01073836.1.p1 GENE.GHVS01073836.1~~GHVS01073836.1.p1  ORF type:complete len:409 (+),score=101.53 GHVS01073836.1:1480-2706(+)
MSSGICVVKILVLGDASCGKTTLLSLLCDHPPLVQHHDLLVRQQHSPPDVNGDAAAARKAAPPVRKVFQPYDFPPPSPSQQHVVATSSSPSNTNNSLLDDDPSSSSSSYSIIPPKTSRNTFTTTLSLPPPPPTPPAPCSPRATITYPPLLIPLGSSQLPRPEWTFGCRVFVPPPSPPFYIPSTSTSFSSTEFWEIGGSQSYSAARNIFYGGVNGVLLLYDMTNRKSYHNLLCWLLELCVRDAPASKALFREPRATGADDRRQRNKKKGDTLWEESDVETCGRRSAGGGLSKRLLSGAVPLFCVGTKLDKLSPKDFPPPRPRAVFPPKQFVLDRLFGGLPVYINKLWDSRVPKSELKQMKELLCSLLDRTSVSYSSAHCGVVDWSSFVSFIASAQQQSPPTTATRTRAL